MNSTEKAPAYDSFRRSMVESRGQIADRLCQQVLATAGPELSVPIDQADVLDVGCGYGHTALELARRCGTVTAVEPSAPLVEFAFQLAEDSGLNELSVVAGTVANLSEEKRFDLVVLDNVLEHVPEQEAMLEEISRRMRPGGVLYIVVPNKLWPIEHHYYLPFLSYLPLRWANAYLRLSGRGSSYEDASYSPTVWRLRRLFRSVPDLRMRLVPPADVSLTMAGGPWHYRTGVALLKRFPALWAISKVFVAVAVKQGTDS